jgi:hypothetical protein
VLRTEADWRAVLEMDGRKEVLPEGAIICTVTNLKIERDKREQLRVGNASLGKEKFERQKAKKQKGKRGYSLINKRDRGMLKRKGKKKHQRLQMTEERSCKKSKGGKESRQRPELQSSSVLRREGKWKGTNGCWADCEEDWREKERAERRSTIAKVWTSRW